MRCRSEQTESLEGVTKTLTLHVEAFVNVSCGLGFCLHCRPSERRTKAATWRTGSQTYVTSKKGLMRRRERARYSTVLFALTVSSIRRDNFKLVLGSNFLLGALYARKRVGLIRLTRAYIIRVSAARLWPRKECSTTRHAST